MIGNHLDKYRDVGLLILRIGIGIAFVVHGWGKITGGPEGWAQLGQAISHVGIPFGYTFFGFMAALSEFGGGILLALGLLTRIAAPMMLCTMIVAASMHIATGQGSPWHAIEAGVLFLSLIFIGPGAYSLDAVLGASDAAEQPAARARA